MTNTSSVVLAAQDGPWSQTRTGVVVEATGSTAVILVGSTTFVASITVPFGVTDTSDAVPAPGTLVTVLRQDSSWTIIGKIFGVTGNLILNGSFENSPTGSFPEDWNFVDLSGASDVSVVNDASAVDGDHVAAVTTTDALAASSYLYSSPVFVNIGETIQLSAFVGAAYEDGTAETADAALYALWFANDTNLYPTTSSADTLVASATDVIPSPPWTPLSGQVVAPVTGAVRLALRSSVIGGQTLLYDFAFVRKVS